MTYKIDKQTRTDLETIASKLPRMAELDQQGQQKFRYGTFKKMGKALLADNPKMKDSNGNPLDPNKFYKVKLPVWIDHQKEIMKAFTLGGKVAVEKYCKVMLEAHKKWQQRTRNPFNRLRSVFNKIKKAASA